MTTTSNSITLEILGKPMILGCPEHEVENLKAAANAVNRVAKEITTQQNVFDRERLAILVGLTLAHELNGHHQEAHDFLELSDELKALLA